VPDGWNFEPLLADRYAVVAGAQHPRAGQTVSIEELHGETWLSMPAGSAARVTFERLFAEFEPRPAMCQISGRVPNILWAMLKSKPLLAMVPASLVHQLLEVGELVEIQMVQTLPLDSLGALYQLTDSPSSVEVLLQVLRESALQH
jgi:DNA-binding transcriptional LysR family regulator